jgi:hypothetical protein
MFRRVGYLSRVHGPWAHVTGYHGRNSADSGASLNGGPKPDGVTPLLKRAARPVGQSDLSDAAVHQ